MQAILLSLYVGIINSLFEKIVFAFIQISYLWAMILICVSI